MLSPNIFTVVAQVKDGCEDPLKRYIAKNVDCASDGKDCGFPYSEMMGMHCCSFVVVDADSDEGLPCYLVFEATYDGPRDDFVADLIESAGTELDKIFRHCNAYPEKGALYPRLVHRFLIAKSLRHSAYFSGIPGRTVAQVRAEDWLHQALSRYLDCRFKDTSERPSSEFDDIQRSLRRAARRGRTLRLTEEKPHIPWQVRYGPRLSIGVALGALLLTAIAVWVCLSCFGLGYDYISGCVIALLKVDPLEVLTTVLVLMLTWAIMRAAQFIFENWGRPRDIGFCLFILIYFIRVLRYGVRGLIFLFATAFALHFASEGTFAGAKSGYWLTAIFILSLIIGLFSDYFQSHFQRMAAFDDYYYDYASNWQTSREAARKFGQDVSHMIYRLSRLGVYMVIAAVVAMALGLSESDIGDLIDLVGIFITLGLYLLAAALLWGVVQVVFMGAVRVSEYCEETSGKYLSARKLTERAQLLWHIYEREEHRTNINQNHFASITYVKNCWFRGLLVRGALLIVNVLARFYDNQGKLGGIPTILSARWVLLDNGRRLLFLTNYLGAWDSYLGEFSHLNASIGVNAIWSNTYVKAPADPKTDRCRPGPKQKVAFPYTKFMFWRGASYEHPFKAYVRQSQIKTLAWYGAYKDLSVPNINDNTKIREDLFRELPAADLDTFFGRL